MVLYTVRYNMWVLWVDIYTIYRICRQVHSLKWVHWGDMSKLHHRHKNNQCHVSFLGEWGTYKMKWVWSDMTGRRRWVGVKIIILKG